MVACLTEGLTYRAEVISAGRSPIYAPVDTYQEKCNVCMRVQIVSENYVVCLNGRTEEEQKLQHTQYIQATLTLSLDDDK